VEDQEPVPVTIVPPRRGKRLRYIVAGGLCAAAVVFLLVGGLSRNIVYFRTVSEAVSAHDKAPDDGARLRMAGAVVTGTLPGDCTAVGIPARVIKQRPPGWHSDGS